MPTRTLKKPDIEFFAQEMKRNKKLLDAAISSYSQQIEKSTLQSYGAHSRVAADAFLQILGRGGKRIRGSLAIVGYKMCGGQDMDMIVRAGMALEMIHAYILIMDDVQDRSLVRRGGPSAHAGLAQYHKTHHLAGDSDHFGLSIAMNAMGIGNHAAQVIVANLDAPEDLRLKALSILNQTVIITAHGQTNDIMNEVSGEVSMRDVDNVLQWKTAHYTFLNPLTFGMVLAGADCCSTDAIREYCLQAGRAFQITDDILGTFGEEFESGKSPLDDIREGKRTVLTTYALEKSDKADQNFLTQMLGNHDLTSLELNRCKEILVDCGALQYAQEQANQSIELARKSLNKEKFRWEPEGVSFLNGLAEFLLSRRA